jgi:hypothetical protein
MTSPPAPDADPPGDPTAIRLAYLRHESSVKSVGWLCYLVVFFCLLGTLEFFLFANGVIPQPPEIKQLADARLIEILFWFMTVAFAILAIVHFAIGFGLTHLQVWARWTVVAIAGFSLVSGTIFSLAVCLARPVEGLLSLVIGGAVNGLILYPMLTPSSHFVFSTAYKNVVLQTPTIKSRMHWLLKLFIGVLLLHILGFLAFLLAIYLRIID